MKYRIIEETERSGEKWYIPQRKFFWFFWTSAFWVDCELVGYKFLDINSAKDVIDRDSRKYRKGNIIKREIIEL